MLRRFHDVRNVILHDDSETGAVHSRIDEATLQLEVEVDRVGSSVHAAEKQADKVAGRLEDGTSLRDGDAVRKGPRELLQGADEALIRALRTVLGKGRLSPECECECCVSVDVREP